MSTCQNVHGMMWMHSMALHILKHDFLDLPMSLAREHYGYLFGK
jgi:hypothetical protein